MVPEGILGSELNQDLPLAYFKAHHRIVVSGTERQHREDQDLEGVLLLFLSLYFLGR